jgi:hypothetical protein
LFFSSANLSSFLPSLLSICSPFHELRISEPLRRRDANVVMQI